MAEKAVKLGLGDAIRRFVDLEWAVRQGMSQLRAQDLQEREMLREALNRQTIDLGFDCDQDGVPDTVEIFQRSVADGCCSLLDARLVRLGEDATRRRRSRRKR